MIAIRSSVTFLLLLVLFATQEVHGQDNSLSERIKRVAIVLDSSTLSSYAPFDLGFGINPDFKVMGIGEQSHGTSEFFKARISLIKFLAKSSGVTKIGLEAPFAEVENLKAVPNAQQSRKQLPGAVDIAGFADGRKCSQCIKTRPKDDSSGA